MAVTVAEATQRDVPVQVRAIGNVQPLATVAVLSMINGEVLKVHFREGQESTWSASGSGRSAGGWRCPT
jgi:multidrug efflux pump subunit AcrA (membrane-fusion protein)